MLSRSEVLKKSRKSKFAKGVSPWLCQNKFVLFLICVFWAKQARKKSFFDILDIKEWFLEQKIELSNSQDFKEELQGTNF